MSNLISTWSKNLKTVPESYVFPPGQRPGDHIVPICKSIPVINLTLETRCEIVRQMVNALEEYGLFQVVKHGVSENLMKETSKLLDEFNNMSSENKASFYINSVKPSKLYKNSLMYSKDQAQTWKDTLTHNCNPIEDHIHNWPDKPARYRDVVGEYTTEVKKMSSIIMCLIAEGLGIQEDYFEDKLTKNHNLVVNYYPPCPDPSLVWGAIPHRDPSLITILQQNVYGLHILKDDAWVGVELIPHAFVFNAGYQLEVITNGKVKSPLHRVMTNSKASRMSMAHFISPSFDSLVEPANGLIDEDNPPQYKDYIFQDFLQTFHTNFDNAEQILDSYKLRD